MQIGLGLSLTQPRGGGGGQTTEQWLAANAAVWLDPSAGAGFDNMRSDIQGTPLGAFGGENYLVYSEEFNTTWTKSGVTITADATTAPDAASTADLIVQNAGATSAPSVYVGSGVTLASTPYKLSIRAKMASRRYLAIGERLSQTGSTRISEFDLQSGVVTIEDANSDATITSLGDGWYLCELTFTCQGTTSQVTFFYPRSTSGSTTVPDDSADCMYLWGAQLRLASDTRGYTRTGVNPILGTAVDGVMGSIKNKGTQGGWFRSDASARRGTIKNVGGLWYIDLDGVDDKILATEQTVGNGSAVSVLVAMRYEGTTDTADKILAHMRSNGTEVYAAYVNGTYGVGGENNNTSFGTSANDVIVADSDQLVEFYSSDGDIYINGVRVVNGTGASLTHDGTSLLYFLSGFSTTSSVNGRFYGALVFNSNLSEADRAKARTYLAAKAGLTL
jgi:hypothetical protein